jgi:hypothetical protein
MSSNRMDLLQLEVLWHSADGKSVDMNSYAVKYLYEQQVPS